MLIPIHLFVTLAALQHAVAAPQGLGSIVTPVECLAVSGVVNTIRLLPSATPFCSSFLGIRTSTVSTTTTTTLPVVTVTTTTTVATSTITPAPVTTTTTITATSSSCSPAPVAPGNRKRQLLPLPLPGPLATFQSAQISTACSCLRIPTPTATATATATSSPTTTSTTSVTATVIAATPTVTATATTTTTIAACPTAQTCNNAGLQYGAFRNTYGRNNAPFYPTYQVDTIKAPNGVNQLIYTGTVPVPGGFNGNCRAGQNTQRVYGSTNNLPCEFWVLDHRGYFFAPLAGTYTFTISNADDIVMLWFRDTARNGWTRANNNALAATPDQASTGMAMANVTLNQAEYLPLRIVFANAQQTGYSFNFAVIDPLGDRIVDSTINTMSSPYFRQFGCDGVTAPAYPQAFGSET